MSGNFGGVDVVSRYQQFLSHKDNQMETLKSNLSSYEQLFDLLLRFNLGMNNSEV